MAKKQFKTESKKLLDMMVNSIYTHKEIFLRELISNASDAIDKLYFKSLTDSSVALKRGDYEIRLLADKGTRTLTISDNGCGMTKEELEKNLGTIAKSGSFDFKAANRSDDDQGIDIIGQFGVGFYSAFMVSDKVTVVSRPYGADTAAKWESEGAEGYTIEDCTKEQPGTIITLHIKDNTEDENYDEYLEEYRLRSLVKKYSDYIRYPIRMWVSHEMPKEGAENEYETVTEDETLNSMIPLWKKSASEVTEEEYATFYRDKFYDYEAPLKTIRQKTEGTSSFEALLFIPSHAPYNYYTRQYEKGLQLYSSGVMIMEKCADLLPDYFSFVNGLVDSADLSLNISREMLQHDRQLKLIAKAIEKKIASELKKLLESDRETYEKFFSAFGTQLKYGLYSDYGMHKEVLQDLVMFSSSHAEKPVTLKEYVERAKEGQKNIFYAAGSSVEQTKLLPQVESVLAHGYEVLFLTDDIDEFALQMLRTYQEKEFVNACKDNLDLLTEEEKESIKKENEASSELLSAMKTAIGDAINGVRFTNLLEKHPVCLSTEGMLSIGMEQVLNAMPGQEEANKVKADMVLEINVNHPIAARLKALHAENPEMLETYSRILYANARLISGLKLDNASEYGDLIADLLVKA